MPEHHRNKPRLSAFAVARRAVVVCAELNVDDVLKFRPGWTVENAQAFLDRHGDTLGEVMLLGALQVMQRLIERGEQHVH